MRVRNKCNFLSKEATLSKFERKILTPSKHINYNMRGLLESKIVVSPWKEEEIRLGVDKYFFVIFCPVGYLHLART